MVPQLFATWTPRQSPLSFGLGVYAPFGLGISYPDDAPFRTTGKRGQIEMLTVNPMLAWRVTPQLSLAAGATLNAVDAELSRGLFAEGDEFKLKGAGGAAGSVSEFHRNIQMMVAPSPDWSLKPGK